MIADQELLERYVRSDDRDALNELFGRHYPAVYQVVLRLVHHEFDARDLTQAVFLRVIERARQLRQPERFRSWLLKVAVNEVKQFQRRRSPLPHHDPLFEVFESTREAPEQRSSRREFEIELDKALETFPEPLKTPLVLRYYEDLSLGEIAEILELPKSTVQSRCERALAELRGRFAGAGLGALLPIVAGLASALREASGTAGASGSIVLGGIVVKSKWMLVGACALVFFAALAVVVFEDGDSDDLAAERETGEAVDGDPTKPARVDAETTDGISASDEAPSRANLRRVASRDPVIQTTGAGRIEGVLLDAENRRPVARAAVSISASHHRLNDAGASADLSFVNRYWTDETGRFVCDRLPLRRVFDLRTEHPDYAYAEVPDLVFHADAKVIDAGAVLLEAGHPLLGRVVDSSGDPVGDALVTASGLRRQLTSIQSRLSVRRFRGERVTTDEAGRFRIPRLAAGYHGVQVEKPGYATLLAGPVQVADGLPSRPRDFVIGPDRSVDGLVVSDGGASVGGAAVEFRLFETIMRGKQGYSIARTWARLQTDADGRFSVDHLPDLERLNIGAVVTHPDFVERYVDEMPPPGRGVDWRIALEPLRRSGGFELRGRIVDERGAPILGSKGTVLIASGAFEIEVAVDTASGSFSAGGLASGAYFLSARVAGHLRSEENVDVGGSASAEIVEIALRSGATLFGRVTDATTGDPLEGAVVTYQRHPGSPTGKSGDYELAGVERGRTLMSSLSISAPGYRTLEPSLSVPAGADRIHRDFRLHPRLPGWAVDGRVLDAARRAVPGAEILLEVWTPNRGHRRARSDGNGSFAFTDVDPEQLDAITRVIVRHPRFARHDWSGTKEDLRSGLELTLIPGRTLRGRVVDQAGDPIAGAQVEVVPVRIIDFDRLVELEQSSLPPSVAGAYTQEDGSFRLDHVPDEALWLVPAGPRHRLLPDPRASIVRVAAGGAPNDLTLGLERGVDIDGVVFDVNGNPMSGIFVKARTGMVATKTDDRGRFDLRGVFGSDIEVHLREPWLEGRVQQAERNPKGLRITAQQCGALVGFVVKHEGQPAAGVEVLLKNEAGIKSARTDEQGRYRFDKIPVGSINVSVGQNTIEAEIVFRESSRAPALQM